MLSVSVFFAANLLFCLAYVVRDMAWLRAITILAASLTLPYFFLQSEPLWSAMGWQVAFIVINGVNLIVLLLERRPVQLTEDQQKLHITTFRTLTPREMLRVIKPAQWHRAPAGHTLIEQGEQLDKLLLIHQGRAEVRRHGEFLANLGPGDFAGEMSFATDQPTSADVIAKEPIDYLIWSRDDLTRLYQKYPNLKDAMQGILGIDMAQKLSRHGDSRPEQPARAADSVSTAE